AGAAVPRQQTGAYVRTHRGVGLQIDVGTRQVADGRHVNRARALPRRPVGVDAQGAGLPDPGRAEGRGVGALKGVGEHGARHLVGADVHVRADATREADAALVEVRRGDLVVVARVDRRAAGDERVGERRAAVVTQHRVEDLLQAPEGAVGAGGLADDV